MSSSNREGWPTASSQPTGPTPQASQQGSEQSSATAQQPANYPPNGNAPQSQQPPPGSLLPRPPSPHHPSSGPLGPTGALPSLSASNPSPPGAHGPLPPQDPSVAARSNPPQPHGSQYPLPGIHSGAPGQALSSQPGYDRDREVHEAREREMRERELNEHERRVQRERDAMEREGREHHQREHPHSEQTPLYQPVAVGPQVRSAIHGPNGLLSNPVPPQNPNQASSPGTSQALLFGPHMNEVTQRQPSEQVPQVPIPFGTPQMQQGPGQQPILNDALSYLDQVKVQFAGRPNVYNQFLDIMKDFKSQAIDTPGVIRRVSSLFAGNPNLIQGFNTFLPPGYRIECGTDGDPNGIRVTTPMGHTVSPMGTTLESRPPPADVGLFNSASGAEQWGEGRDGHPDQREGVETPEPSMRPQEARFGQARLSPMDGGPREHADILMHQQDPRDVSNLPVSSGPGDSMPRQPPGRSVSPSARSVGAGEGPGGAQGPQASERKGPVEFNHAISYVNKIKNRFAQQPEIYKQFLEILQTYQRESKPIQDVYAQVTHLFNDAPDLLQDFKQFLPESAAHAKAAAVRQAAEDMTTTSSVRSGPDFGPQAGPSRHTPRPEQHRLPPVGNFAPTPSAGRDNKRKRGGGQGPVGGISAVGHDLAPLPGTRTGFGPNKRAKHSQQQPPARPQAQMDVPAVSPTLVPALPAPMPPQTSTAASHEELNFFERVKKSIGNKNTMNEFLKLCNMFSQDLIDKNVLIYRAQNFIGDNQDLFNWFKAFVGFDSKNLTIDNKPKAESGRVSLNNCRGYGPSYRLMPKVERLKVCSGRDELCHSVLNNDWVSHPTWASEDSGFIAHRKNIHEEGLHRIEEERHDYDHHVAVCERAIQLLEPFAQQISLFSTDEERKTFKLPVDLGGQSQAVFKRTLTKIYGRDYGLQVLNMLPENPASVVPIVLMRMRQKVEEWKLSQREWEKIWRDQTQRMFWRSLDHQGINAKIADKRQFQTKTLQNEIQVKYEEQRRQRQGSNKIDTKVQMQWSFTDQDVLLDASALLLIYTEAHQSSDVGRLATLIKEFIPLFFGLDMEAFQTKLQEVSGSTPASEEADDDAHVSDDSGVSRGRRTNGRKQDLLRDVLEKGRKSARNDKEGSVASGSRASTPDAASTADQEMIDVAEAAETEVRNTTWIPHSVDGNISSKQSHVKPNEPFKRSVFNLYANLPIYCFFRVFVILYERLSHLKANEKEVHETVRRAKMSKTANELKMVDKHPDNFFSDTSATANYYQQMLGMLRHSLKRDDTIEQGHMEEILRRYYLSSGWMLYSFEKMLAAIVRFGSAILGNESKERSNEILQLFLKDRRKESTTHQDELIYRKQVEKYVKDGDIYRISYNPTTASCTARILRHEETTFEIPDQEGASSSGTKFMDGVYTPEQRWNYYVASYRSLDPTEGVPQDQVSQPFLKHHLNIAMKAALAAAVPTTEENADGETEAAIGDNANVEKSATEARTDQLISFENLRFRISIFTYKLEWSDPLEKSKSGEEIEEWWLAVPLQHQQMKQAKGSSSEIKDNEVGENGVDADTENTGDNATAEIEANGADANKASQSSHVREHEHEAEDGQARFEEKFVMNNKWMAGLSRDAVDEINKEYRDWIGKISEDLQSDASEAKQAQAADASGMDNQEAGEDVNMAE